MIKAVQKKAVHLLGRPVLADKVAIAPAESDVALNIAGVYQDFVTREWALQTCRRATRLAGEERIQNTWYNTNSLSDPAVLLHAVHTAAVADVILVSVHASDELPPELCVWIDAWLPLRPPRVGVLTALIGVAQPLEPQSLRALNYLEAVARKAQLDFIPQQRQRPVPSSSFIL
jgi:hypothetical protein